jgi:hypothetical protein
MMAFARSSAITTVVLCATVGCPQLKEDDFEPLLGGDAGATSGSAGAAGLGGNGGGAACNAAGGCDADAGLAGASGAGGSAGASTAGAGGSQATVGCGPEEVIAPNGVCYFIDPTTRTWADARASCQARGSGWDLVTIYDTARNDFVLSITGFEAWIGATDAADEGAWVWVDADASFFEVAAATNAGFANWTAGEPNDFDGSDCLRILTTGLWADWPCDSLLGQVCRRTPP